MEKSVGGQVVVFRCSGIVTSVVNLHYYLILLWFFLLSDPKPKQKQKVVHHTNSLFFGWRCFLLESESNWFFRLQNRNQLKKLESKSIYLFDWNLIMVGIGINFIFLPWNRNLFHFFVSELESNYRLGESVLSPSFAPTLWF